MSCELNRYLTVGKIVGVRGLKGELKVVSFCDSAEDFCRIKSLCLSPDALPLVVQHMRVGKGVVILKIGSFDSVEETLSLIGRVLYACRDDIVLEEGRYFVEDILGLEVTDINTEEIYGIIYDVLKTGANDIYCIKDDQNKKYFLPVITDFVRKIDLADKKVWVCPIKGIFND